jgi:hypothetical protein
MSSAFRPKLEGKTMIRRLFVLFALLAWACTTSTSRDTDGDGVADAQDACPDVPGVKTNDPLTNGCLVGTLRVKWAITEGNVESSCALGDEVRVTSTGGGSTFIDKYNCVDLAADILLRTGTYSVTFELLDAAGNLVVPGATAPVVIASNQISDAGTVVFQIAAQTGTISATWGVSRNLVATTCASVSAVTFEIRSTPIGGGAAIIDQFICSKMAGTTDPLDAGDYHVSVDLLDAGDHMLNLVTVSGTVHVVAGANTALPNRFVFDFQ